MVDEGPGRDRAVGASAPSAEPSSSPGPTIWLLLPAKDIERSAAKPSYRRIIEAARRRGAQARVVDPRALRIDVDGLRLDGAPVATPDIVIPRACARLNAESRAVLRNLVAAGAAPLPSLEGFHRARCKHRGYRALRAAGLPTPLTRLVRDPGDYPKLERRLGRPFVLKRAVGSKGRDLRLVGDPQGFGQAIQALGADRRLIAQRFVTESAGCDLRVFVVDGVALDGMLRQAPPGDFRANAHRGAQVSAFPITDQIRVLAEAAAEALGLAIAGVDLLFGADGFEICEVNGAPGLDAFESACGPGAGQAILDLALRTHAAGPRVKGGGQPAASA